MHISQHLAVPSRKQRLSLCWMGKLCLFCFGLVLLAGSGAHLPALASHPASVVQGAATSRSQASSPDTGQGAGAATSGRQDGCDDNLFTDPDCWMHHRLNGVATWMAQGTLNLLAPMIQAISNHPLNFITHTPPAATYQSGSVQLFVNFSLTVVTAALLLFIVVAGYNLMMGDQLGIRHHGLAQMVPRVILAVIAAHFSLLFAQWMIDLNNALNDGVVQLNGLTVLTNVYTSVFTGNITEQGWVIFVLAFTLSILDLLLAWQMLVRLAFLTILLALGPLALLCFALPQTQHWGKLWLSNLSMTVFVQFFQVTTLALGSMFASELLAPSGSLASFFPFDPAMLPFLLSIAVFFLTLRIPGMLYHWMLRGVSQQAGATAVEAAQGAVQGAIEFIGNVAPRLLALL